MDGLMKGFGTMGLFMEKAQKLKPMATLFVEIENSEKFSTSTHKLSVYFNTVQSTFK